MFDMAIGETHKEVRMDSLHKVSEPDQSPYISGYVILRGTSPGFHKRKI